MCVHRTRLHILFSSAQWSCLSLQHCDIGGIARDNQNSIRHIASSPMNTTSKIEGTLYLLDFRLTVVMEPVTVKLFFRRTMGRAHVLFHDDFKKDSHVSLRFR